MHDSPVRDYVNQLRRGLVEPLMLHIIGELPSHGYRIAKEVERRSSGYFKLTASTVYSALRRFEDEGTARDGAATTSPTREDRYWAPG